jgi:hypothetical protein
MEARHSDADIPRADGPSSFLATELRGRYRLAPSGAIVELDLVLMPLAEWDTDPRKKSGKWLTVCCNDVVAAARICP